MDAPPRRAQRPPLWPLPRGPRDRHVSHLLPLGRRAEIRLFTFRRRRADPPGRDPAGHHGRVRRGDRRGSGHGAGIPAPVAGASALARVSRAALGKGRSVARRPHAAVLSRSRQVARDLGRHLGHARHRGTGGVVRRTLTAGPGIPLVHPRPFAPGLQPRLRRQRARRASARAVSIGLGPVPGAATGSARHARAGQRARLGERAQLDLPHAHGGGRARRRSSDQRAAASPGQRIAAAWVGLRVRRGPLTQFAVNARFPFPPCWDSSQVLQMNPDIRTDLPGPRTARTRRIRSYWAVLILGGAAVWSLPAFAAPVWSDPLTGSQIDTTHWIGSNSTADVALVPSSEGVLMSIAGSAHGSSFVTNLASLCWLGGDFDFQVDYKLGSWPAQSGVRSALIASSQAGFGAAVQRDSLAATDVPVQTPGSEVYLVDFEPHSGTFPDVPTADVQGTL